ncbi:MAG TPA: prepilin-type N-terminal cleavage/methylation domain-containing protein [Terriglobales bacterium]|nr:prepilin-type N-terminal cleavage/methylation domain-containing protein [Terriglobales bacterium]
MNTSKRKRSQRGFSLLEMIIVLSILTIVMAGIFGMMDSAQKRYAVEDTKLDLQQESRQFLDQIVRDLHQAGFPNARMYATTPANGANSAKVAIGLVRVSLTDIIFEGDVDGNGTVNVVRYQVYPDNGSNCPCTLRRSQEPKTEGAATDDQTYSWSSEVQRVLNTSGAGNSPLGITGDTFGTANDTLYADYKQAPLFQFYDQNGVIVSGIPTTLNTSGSGMDAKMLASIRSIRVTINTLASAIDVQTRRYPAVSMTSSARISNNRL